MIVFKLLLPLIVAVIAAIFGYWIVAAVALSFFCGIAWMIYLMQDAIKYGALVVPEDYEENDEETLRKLFGGSD